MYHETTTLELVDLIYDAVADPRKWQRFLDLLAETIDGHHVALSTVDAQSGSVAYLAASRSDPQFRDEYHKHFAACDPWVVAGRARGLLRPGIVGLGEHILPSSIYATTDFFNDLGRRYGFLGGIAGMFGGPSSLVGISASQRRSGDFGDSDVSLFRILLPHLERAFDLSRRLAAADVHCRSVLEMLDKMPAAAILVDIDGKPVLMNSAAHVILSRRDGLSSTRSGLCGNTTAETHALRRLLSTSARTATLDAGSAGGAMKLSRRASPHPLHVLVSRLCGTGSRGEGQAGAVVFIQDPERAQCIDCERLTALYRLTSAEARIGAMLALGSSVNEISKRLQVTRHTVRTHVKHLFGKTDTKTQAQLVRVIITSLAAFPDSDSS